MTSAPVVIWDTETTACSMPTLAGFAVFGAIGAYATPRRRAQGALNGVWGSWLGCALASAMGISGPAATALTLAGAYAAARIA